MKIEEEKQPSGEIWGGKRESNPQPSEPQSGALPVELFPPPWRLYNRASRDVRNVLAGHPRMFSLLSS